MFYLHADSADLKGSSPDSILRKVASLADVVSNLSQVSPDFVFGENDPPAEAIFSEDIISARLRGAYWDAHVLTYRPFIKMVLEFNHQRMYKSSNSGLPANAVCPWNAPSTRVIELARRGIKALVESTKAFDGLGDKRPMIANIFGTAHT